MKKVGFSVAELPFVCLLPESVEIKEMLPSFLPFQAEVTGEPVFTLQLVEEVKMPDNAVCLENFSNDLGHVTLYREGGSFFVQLKYGEDCGAHRLCMKADASKGVIALDWKDPMVKQALVSMLRIVFSQRVLLYDGFSIHASTVVKEGMGYLFLGKSGTGKSTHSRLWMETWPEVELLNDDNPIVRMVDGQCRVYGSPWSGKTPCYQQRFAPLKGMVRLRQAKENRWTKVTGVLAWTTVYPSCAVMKEETALFLGLQKSLNKVVERVNVGILDCLPDREAAELSWKNLKV